MDLDTIVKILCVIGLAVSYIGCLYHRENVYLKYQERTIPYNEKGAKK